ncbi:MAG: ACP S-malonyltransferase [Spirochaetes bacterium]|uniref:Malonyl CoA-acyl carrier protein transacylase n=1 Tax=Candidatus Ornithospirochaeta stercoripullorum TaxID=2840899 RepID=A0A9D9E087_9SPIO|nr:ACP S-malonyltransferase [Candidatus Ornithospirochaeta stercoripullorum]
MGKIAFVFSGQGAQAPGMGKDLYESSPAARAVSHTLDEIRKGTLEMCFSGSAEDLQKTENTQPCMYLTECAAAAALREAGITPDAVAGFSLGEIAALSEAGIVSVEDGFRIVSERGRLMQKEAESHPAVMDAVLKLSDEEVEETASLFAEVYPVNYNSPGQVVVSAAESSIADFEAKVKERGGRTMRLRVAGGFHSPFMHEAAESFAKELEKYPFKGQSIPIYSNVTGQAYEEDPKPLLSKQIESPVRWVTIVRNMIASGIDTFIEVGPGTTLTGLIKRIDSSVRTFNVSDAESIRNITMEVKNG